MCTPMPTIVKAIVICGGIIQRHACAVSRCVRRLAALGFAGMALWLGCASASRGEVDAAPAVELSAGKRWRFAAPPPASLAALDRVWGQFELRLPVPGFSVPAPNCKGSKGNAEIRLRWIALTPDTPGRSAMLAQRWALLQRLQALQAPGSVDEPVLVLLDLRHYTRRAKDGTLQLQYCNAFVRNDGP